MKNIFTIIIAVVASVAAVKFTQSDSTVVAQEESAYERVMRTGTIRCGYALAPPYTYVDPNTGKVQGITADVMHAVGKELNVDIEWTEEVGWGNIKPSLSSGRIDVMCSSVWADGNRIKQFTLAEPAFYSSLHAFVRVDDFRFDNGAKSFNSKDVRIVGIDGDVTSVTARIDYPKATLYALPELASVSDFYLSVVNGRADVMMVDELGVKEFAKTNPGVLRKVEGIPPTRIFGESIALEHGEYALRDMINGALRNLVNNGKIEKIAKKYSENHVTQPSVYKVGQSLK